MPELLSYLLALAALAVAVRHSIDHSRPTLGWVERRRRRSVRARALYEASEAALAAYQKSIGGAEQELVRRTARRRKPVDDRQAVLEFGAVQ